jgi:hypothetical protein
MLRVTEERSLSFLVISNDLEEIEEGTILLIKDFQPIH